MLLSALAWGHGEHAMSIHQAARSGDIEALSEHIEHETDVNSREHGSTALHWAAYVGQLEVVKMLLEAKADINAENDDGRSPLDNARDALTDGDVEWLKKEFKIEVDLAKANAAKKEIAAFLEQNGGQPGPGKGFPWWIFAFTPIVLFILGIIYAASTKPKAEAMPTPTTKIIVVTSPVIPGKKIVRTLGLVRGNTIRARHVGKDIMAGLRNLVGGEVTEYAKLLAESREQALDRMLADAEKLGANGIISVAFTTSVIMGGAAEMMAYGTAVVIEDE